MIRPCVTISLVPEAKGGPFIFWNDLEKSCIRAAQLGFAAVEIFLPSANAINASTLSRILSAQGLQLAALGTGAGWILHRWHLTHRDSSVRQQARDFIRGFIDLAGQNGAATIVGSIQGRHENGISRDQALNWLTEGLNDLAGHAQECRVPLLYEP